ncbi:hypothetical protein [Shewanella aestuarii]|uniref:Uncharacterized protein n=1 Tax=Shewanella aestuarii TaxID=1028752 RepID=A0A6G9QQH9_9GAMM|nr:hypothetical protein [Shewanella aestuarii]QIR16678.1 hypothetical protein HBH39_19590 [Shewanella aestuarii]
MNKKERARKYYASLMLQSADDVDEFATVLGLSNKMEKITKNDLAKKLRHSSTASSRGITKSDFLNVQLMALLKHQGFDFGTAKFDENMMLTRISGPKKKVFGFKVKESDEELAVSETITSLFGMDAEQKEEIIDICRLTQI